MVFVVNRYKIVFLLSILLSFQIVLAQTQLTVKASQLQPRKYAAYDFAFVASQEIAKDAEIDIVFPKEFILSKVVMADSRAMNGGLTVEVKGDTVKVKRSGRGNSVPAGSSIDVKLASVINARDMAKDFNFLILIKQQKNIIAPVRYTTGVSLIAARQQ